MHDYKLGGEAVVIKYEMSKLVKLVDAFTGKSVEKAKILLHEKNRFMDKGNGFYVAINLENGLYDAKIQANGYILKQVDIEVSENDSVQLIMLTPNRKIDMLQVPVQLNCPEVPVHKIDIFYTIDTPDLKRIITANVQVNDKEIKLQNNIFLSLEGRKIGFASGDVLQLGELSYSNGKYNLSGEIREGIPMGASCNLLLETQTDEKGLAILEIPSYMVQNEDVELKIYKDSQLYKYTLMKKVYINLLSNKKQNAEEVTLNLEIGSDE